MMTVESQLLGVCLYAFVCECVRELPAVAFYHACLVFGFQPLETREALLV